MVAGLSQRIINLEIRLFELFRLSKQTFMNIFRRPHYESDTTQFIEKLKADKPQLESEQRQGRSLLWEPKFDSTLQTEFAAAKVKQGAYVYQTKH